MLADDLHATFLTGGLSSDQLAEMIEAGDEFRFAAGAELFREGEAADYLWVLLEGSIELSRQSGSDIIVLATMATPGQWAGGLLAWGDAASIAGYRATGRAVEPGRAFRLPSEDLGRLVGAWFPFGKHMIMGLYQTVRTIEATARQRESLVALGTMAAGLAHEINNPAAASLRAVEEMRTTCDAMLASLSSLASHSITADQFMRLDELRLALAVRPTPEADALATMDREDRLSSWMDRHEVEGGWELAPKFASSGADEDWLDEMETAVGPAALEPALRWAATTVSAAALLSELTDTTNRISNLVEAVKSYSQMDRASSQRIDVHEGLANTLVMLAPKLRDIEVLRSFDPDVPAIEAFPAELNQVWTNLIDNAIDAMAGRGSLAITTRREADHIIVDIADDGHGMGADVQARAFEPFFTTKDVGKGTGLGLDISRRIVVERHGGDITFESVPGTTTARVRLPISR